MKYELTNEKKELLDRTLYRIRAVKDFELCDGTIIHAGELGGWIEKEYNLSQEGSAWVFGRSTGFSGEARVYRRSMGFRQSTGFTVKHGFSGEARVYGEAWVFGKAQVFGKARVYGEARVYGKALVSGEADIFKTEHYIVIGPAGSRHDCTTFYRNKNNGISVICGCFKDSIEDFLARVNETHGDNKHGQVYRAAAELAKLQIDLEG